MKHVIASLRSGNWEALLACFLYFDTGFTVRVMFGGGSLRARRHSASTVVGLVGIRNGRFAA